MPTYVEKPGSKTKTLYDRKVAAGRLALSQLEPILEDPMARNTELLLKLLQDNKDTELGKKLGFGEIHSVEEFQRRIPVSTYDDYAEYIDRMANKGETDLICAYPIVHYNKSSGTMGVPKKIPMSAPAKEVYQRYVAEYPYGLVDRELGDQWTSRRALQVATCRDTVPTLPCGATYGALSATTILRYRSFLNEMYISPDAATFARLSTDTKYLHARYALAYKPLASIQSSFYSFVVELLRYIRNNWEMLVQDIREGTIDPSVKMDADVREELLAELEPMPERADELEAVFQDGGAHGRFLKKVWPELKYIQGIGTGAFSVYADVITHEFATEDIKLVMLGVAASEGTFTVPVALSQGTSVLLPDSVFFEFLPLEADDDFSQIVTLDKVEPGKRYELIITSQSGFYRYRMRDAIEITGKYKNTPTINFLYRLDNTLSIMGEKTTEAALQKAAFDTADELGFELIDFSAFGDINHSPVRYIFFMELGRTPAGLSPKEIRFVLDQKLAIANPSMGDKIASGTCGKTRINFLEEGTYALYKDVMIEIGTAPGQIKPVRVIRNERQRRLFFTMTDYSAEYLK